MRLKHYDNLRNFLITARHESLTSAADELCLTKGALSQQIRTLEEELGFSLFERHSRGIRISAKGQELFNVCQTAFSEIEGRVLEIAGRNDQALTIGTTTYFASRWLSPRLMDFIRQNPNIRLRIQPMIDVFGLARQQIDLAIRWGDGNWNDAYIEELFNCPVWPTGNQTALESVERLGTEQAFSTFTLLRDREGSNAWSEWYDQAGLKSIQRADTLIVPDPNVRVQAVLDGQGVALNDSLIDREIADGEIFRLSRAELSNYGYHLAFRKDTQPTEAVLKFADWIRTAVALDNR